MGLDMYLYAERYVSAYSFQREAENARLQKEVQLFDTLTGLVGAQKLVAEDSPSVRVCVTIGYWRKANAIHQWFVSNVQDGKDECQLTYVPREQLVRLREACRAVLADPAKGPSLLPTQSGFFFGGTDYGEGYLNDLRDTARIIDKALSTSPEEWEIYYRSSW